MIAISEAAEYSRHGIEVGGQCNSAFSICHRPKSTCYLHRDWCCKDLKSPGSLTWPVQSNALVGGIEGEVLLPAAMQLFRSPSQCHVSPMRASEFWKLAELGADKAAYMY